MKSPDIPGRFKLLREYLQVREVQLAVEWVADALAQRRLALNERERNELLDAARDVATEDHVRLALSQCPFAGG